MVGYHRYVGHDLSPRERDVIDLMAKGLTNGEIADRLDISFATAKNHVSAVIGKLGVDTREEAVRLWRQEQRVGARFSRATRGIVVGVGLGKVAAAIGVTAVVGLGSAIGLALLWDGPGNTRAEKQGDATTGLLSAEVDISQLFHVMTVQSGNREISLGVMRWGDEVRHYVWDEADPAGGVSVLTPIVDERWLDDDVVERFGVLYGWFSDEIDAERTVEVVFEGMDPIPVQAMRPHADAGISLRFWMISVEGVPPYQEILVVDRTYHEVYTTNPDSDWPQRLMEQFDGWQPTPTPLP